MSERITEKEASTNTIMLNADHQTMNTLINVLSGVALLVGSASALYAFYLSQFRKR
jgi:hypothetical protein